MAGLKTKMTWLLLAQVSVLVMLTQEVKGQAEGKCEDTDTRCPLLRNEGFCIGGDIKKRCPYSCGECTSIELCTDIVDEERCRRFKSVGKCTDPKTRVYMLANCKKTCELCLG